MNFLPLTPQRAFSGTAHSQVKGKGSAGTVNFHTVMSNYMYPGFGYREAA